MICSSHLSSISQPSHPDHILIFFVYPCFFTFLVVQGAKMGANAGGAVATVVDRLTEAFFPMIAR